MKHESTDTCYILTLENKLWQFKKTNKTYVYNSAHTHTSGRTFQIPTQRHLTSTNNIMDFNQTQPGCLSTSVTTVVPLCYTLWRKKQKHSLANRLICTKSEALCDKMKLPNRDLKHSVTPSLSLAWWRTNTTASKRGSGNRITTVQEKGKSWRRSRYHTFFVMIEG